METIKRDENCQTSKYLVRTEEKKEKDSILFYIHLCMSVKCITSKTQFPLIKILNIDV
jgi:hypothetical protein